jgi:hypothetical protein
MCLPFVPMPSQLDAILARQCFDRRVLRGERTHINAGITRTRGEVCLVAGFLFRPPRASALSLNPRDFGTARWQLSD